MQGWPAGQAGRKASHPEQRSLRVGEIAEARFHRSADELRHGAVEVPADEPFDRAVRIDDHERAAAQCKPAADGSGEAHDVGDVAAVDQLRARDDALDDARAKYERMRALARLAPEADAAKAGVRDQEIALEWLVRRRGYLPGCQ